MLVRTFLALSLLIQPLAFAAVPAEGAAKPHEACTQSCCAPGTCACSASPEPADTDPTPPAPVRTARTTSDLITAPTAAWALLNTPTRVTGAAASDHAPASKADRAAPAVLCIWQT